MKLITKDLSPNKQDTFIKLFYFPIEIYLPMGNPKNLFLTLKHQRINIEYDLIYKFRV